MVDTSVWRRFQDHDARRRAIRQALGGIAGGGGGREIGPVGGGGDKNDITMLAVMAVVSLEEFQSDQFALGARDGLGSEAGEPGDLAEPFLGLP